MATNRAPHVRGVLSGLGFVDVRVELVEACEALIGRDFWQTNLASILAERIDLQVQDSLWLWIDKLFAVQKLSVYQYIRSTSAERCLGPNKLKEVCLC